MTFPVDKLINIELLEEKNNKLKEENEKLKESMGVMVADKHELNYQIKEVIKEQLSNYKKENEELKNAIFLVLLHPSLQGEDWINETLREVIEISR